MGISFFSRTTFFYSALFMIMACLLGNKAFAFDKEIAHKDFSIVLSSQKNFVGGKNEFTLAIKKGNTFVKDADVKLSFTMPEMPGMPKMTELATLTLDGDMYKGSINFPHGGTWQIRLQFSHNGKKYQAKSSIDF